MKRLIIIVEGQTEEEFVNQSLRKYFFEEEIYSIAAIKISTSRGHKGGFVNYTHLRNDIKKVLAEPHVIVSTFLDFFRIPTSVPKYNEMTKEQSIDRRIEILENGIKEDIADPRDRLIPYIQKFEFEALLFSSNKGFEEMYDNEAIVLATNSIVQAYENPEEINDSPWTAPSKRLMRIMADNGEIYDKVTEGNLIAEEIGIEIIMEKCPRFRNWIETLVQKMKE